MDPTKTEVPNSNPDGNIDTSDIDIESYFSPSTIDKVIPKETVPPSKDDGTPSDILDDSIEDLFSPKLPDTEENKPAETEDDKKEKIVLEAKVGETITPFDLTNPDEKNKAVAFIQKGMNYEKKMAEFNQEKSKTLTAHHAQAIGLAFQELYLQSQGKINKEDYIELPYEQFEGKTDTTQGDIELWNKHKSEVAERRANLEAYARDRKNTEAQFEVIQNDFFSKHKDIKDPDKWLEENLYPYHAPVMTFGKVAYPPDTLEMIWFWKNKDRIFEAMLFKHNANIATSKQDKPVISGRTPAPRTPKKEFDKYIEKVFSTGNDEDIVS